MDRFVVTVDLVVLVAVRVQGGQVQVFDSSFRRRSQCGGNKPLIRPCQDATVRWTRHSGKVVGGNVETQVQ